MVCEQPRATEINFRCSATVALGDSSADVAFPDGRACTAQIAFNNGGIILSTKVVSCVIPRHRSACSSDITLPYGSRAPEIAGVTVAPVNLSDDEQLQLGIIARKDYPKVTLTEKSIVVEYRYVGPSLRGRD